VVGSSRLGTPTIELLSQTTLKEAAYPGASNGEIRVVLDATGFLHDDVHGPEKSWRELRPAQMARSFALRLALR